MGGLVLEKTLGPAIVAAALRGDESGRFEALDYDLIVSANPSTEALYSEQLVDILRRHRLRLVLEDELGNRTGAGGPLLASITSESDSVTRWMVPLAMGVNSLFVRYRADAEPDRPSQRHLGLHTAGHVPFLHSHRVEISDDELVFHEIPGRWNDTPFWIFQVPPEVSADHADIDSLLWWRMMLRLMEANRVFDPGLELRLVGESTTNSDRL
jgi:hypothetical protein